MAPEIENEDGLFRWSTENRQWLCVRGSVPGMGPGSHANRFVYLDYGNKLTKAAMSQGFERKDFGYVPPKAKGKRAAVGSAKRTSKRIRKPKGLKMILDLSG